MNNSQAKETQIIKSMNSSDPEQRGAANPPHVCLLGPSGIGKSPLAALFNLQGFEPYRVRVARDQKDRLVCKPEYEAREIFRQEFGPLTKWNITEEQKRNDTWFHVGTNWLFFTVRGQRQCLQCRDDKGCGILETQKRLEIFAPRLADILDDKDGSGKLVRLNSENLSSSFSIRARRRTRIWLGVPTTSSG